MNHAGGVTEAGGAPPGDPPRAASPLPAQDVLGDVFRAHYRSLLRLAALLADDPHTCEDLVQEAFARVHASRRRGHEPDDVLPYLRQTVMNLARSRLRRRLIAVKHAPKLAVPDGSPGAAALEGLERSALVTALRHLPRRQREAVVLRHYADLSERQTAALMGISLGSVKSYTSQALVSLRTLLEEHS